MVETATFKNYKMTYLWGLPHWDWLKKLYVLYDKFKLRMSSSVEQHDLKM
jgi:hypothetical protein